MRRERTNESQRPTLRLVGDGAEDNGSASTTYGCESQDSTISHRILSHQLSVLLNDLERGIDDLESKSSKAYATFTDAMEILVKHYRSIIQEDTTDVVE